MQNLSFISPEGISKVLLNVEEYPNSVILTPKYVNKGIAELFETEKKEILFYRENPDVDARLKRYNVITSESFFLEDKCSNVVDLKNKKVKNIVVIPSLENLQDEISYVWQIAPEASQIIVICPHGIFREDSNRSLKSIISKYGLWDKIETSIDDFDLIRLFKPIESSTFDYEGFYLDEEQHDSPGLMKHNEVREIVGLYISLIKRFDEFVELEKKMNQPMQTLGIWRFGGLKFYYSNTERDKAENKTDFILNLQKECWSMVFKKLNMERYITSQVQNTLDNFVKHQSQYPFSVKNIYRMLEIIIGTLDQTMNRSLVETVDDFTKYTKENRHDVKGWSTNSGYLLNPKFIVNSMVEQAYRGEHLTTRNSKCKLDDLTKVLCFLTGTPFPGNFHTFMTQKENRIMPGKWVEWGFFTIKGYKKGSVHVKFNNMKDWETLNRAYGKAKGQVLPEKMI